MTIVASILLTLAVAWCLVLPHLAASESGEGVPEYGEEEQLIDQKSRCLQVLRDLELDFSTDKIASTDYERMKATVSIELATILKRLDRGTHG